MREARDGNKRTFFLLLGYCINSCNINIELCVSQEKASENNATICASRDVSSCVVTGMLFSLIASRSSFIYYLRYSHTVRDWLCIILNSVHHNKETIPCEFPAGLKLRSGLKWTAEHKHEQIACCCAYKDGGDPVFTPSSSKIFQLVE